MKQKSKPKLELLHSAGLHYTYVVSVDLRGIQLT